MTELEPLTWKACKVKLGDLIPNPDNPKYSTEDNAARLQNSIDTLGQFETLAVDHDGKSAIDGHQRLNAWIAEKGADFVVDARKPNRPLTEQEKHKIILYSGRGTHGSWDFDMLANLYEMEELTEFGGFDEDFLLGGAEDPPPDKGKEQYTRAIEPPTYEPTSEKPPPVADLVSTAKTDELIKRIKQAQKDKTIPAKVAAFLQLAAARHTVFDYGQIAEFYAHADKDTQKLFEDSALVIIDFDSAIENGFVQLSSKLDKIFDADIQQGEAEE